MKNIMIMVVVAILSFPVQAECNGTPEYCSYKYEMEKERRLLGASIGRGLYLYRYGGGGSPVRIRPSIVEYDNGTLH